MKQTGDRQKLKKALKEFLKYLNALVARKHEPTFEEFMELETKKYKTPSHKRIL